MAQKVEDSINFVWRVERSRSIAQRITEYLSLVLIVPIVLVTSITMIASVRSTAMMQQHRIVPGRR